MRLVRAELLKIRRRQATYVLLIVQLVLGGLIFLTTGSLFVIFGIIEFPAAYTIFKEVAFGLGSLIAVVFAAAYVGADWNWGVVRNIVARGESRERYLLAKCAALAIVLAIALVIVFAVSFLLTYLLGFINNLSVASPLRGDGLQDLVAWLVAGYPVLLQRAVIGVAVAVVFRSQLAGAVVGIVLYLAESVITTILSALSFGRNLGDPFNQVGQPSDPQWFQFLPISIGGNVLDALPAGFPASAGDFASIFVKPVDFPIAMFGVFVYLIGALAIALVAIRRQEIP